MTADDPRDRPSALIDPGTSRRPRNREAGPAGPSPAFRLDRLREVSDGDAAFESEMLGCLRDDLRRGLERAEAAVEGGDPGNLAGAAHALGGACRTVGADALAGRCRDLERAAARPSFRAGPRDLVALRLAADALLFAIDAHLRAED